MISANFDAPALASTPPYFAAAIVVAAFLGVAFLGRFPKKP
jgi:hypothetical protein